MFKDVVVPIPGFPSFITTALIYKAIACLIVAGFIITIWKKLPKGVLIAIVLIGGVAAGLVSLKFHK